MLCGLDAEPSASRRRVQCNDDHVICKYMVNNDTSEFMYIHYIILMQLWNSPIFTDCYNVDLLILQIFIVYFFICSNSIYIPGVFRKVPPHLPLTLITADQVKCTETDTLVLTFFYKLIILEVIRCRNSL